MRYSLVLLGLLSVASFAGETIKIGSHEVQLTEPSTNMLAVQNVNVNGNALFYIQMAVILQPDEMKEIKMKYGITLKAMNAKLYYAFGTPEAVNALVTRSNVQPTVNTNGTSQTFLAAEAKVSNKYSRETFIADFSDFSKAQNGDLIVSLHSIVDLSPDALKLVYSDCGFSKVEKIRTEHYKVELPEDKLMTLLNHPETLFIDPAEVPLTVDNEEQIVQINTASNPPIGSTNVAVAQQSNVDDLWTSPYNLSGSGVKVGVVDGGRVRTTHQELLGRVTDMTDHTNGNNASSDHATHVSGTIGATGIVSAARGMANGTSLYGYSFYDVSGATSVQTMVDDHSLILSNHSYGIVYSYVSTNSLFGYYSSGASDLDAKIVEEPNHIYFKSAGNDRADYDYDFNDAWSDNSTLNSWGVVNHEAVAKNIIVMAAADNDSLSQLYGIFKDIDNSGGYSAGDPFAYLNPTASDYTQLNPGIAYFSSPGPSSDGRIKPDLAADGFDVYSTSNASDTSYAYKNGTSMSAPASTGSAALIVEAYRNIYGTDSHIRSDLMKALLINSVYDVGTQGPDYAYGYGIIDAKAAVDTLQSDNGQATQLITASVTNGATKSYTFTLTQANNIQVSLAWIDPAGDPAYQSDLLINDLDLYIESSTGTKYYPWKLDKNNPSNAATRTSENRTDNAVKVDASLPAGTYTVKIVGFEVTGTQDYALVSSHPIKKELSETGINPGIIMYLLQ